MRRRWASATRSSVGFYFSAQRRKNCAAVNLTASISRMALPTCLSLSLLACGGGGGNAAPPPPNRSPELRQSIGDQPTVQFHEVDYDATQGGRVFVDPDGDTLNYDITFQPTPNGLQVSGTRVVGRPQTTVPITVSITARDARGGIAFTSFNILVAPNGAPQPMNPRADKLVQVGESFTLDATLGGARLTDPEGDPLVYLVTLRGNSGVAVNGTQLSGQLNAVGAVEVTLTGTDPFGASTETLFVIAAPGPAPDAPTLPPTPYVYRDESLPLPDDFKTSSEFRVPLWDTQPIGNRTTDAGAALGRVLFHDKRLSITNTVACVSCHQRDHGFASPERFNTGAIGIPLTRNAMALANARYNTHGSWFADLRASSLQEVARQALTRPDEMGNTLPAIEEKLRATPLYAPLFEAAFGSPEIDADRVLRALEQYVQALISYRSPYDQACDAVGGVLKDCDLGLTAQEARGRAIFNSGEHVACAHCHSLPAGSNIWLANNGLDAGFTDPGVGNGRFRPASLHNIALTAPYMHDGRFATLREVIDHYDHGVKESPDLDSLLRDDAGHAVRLNLSGQDKDALEAFLHTLTDHAMLADPKFSNPFE
jgi:cytochrome c peroxidase